MSPYPSILLLGPPGCGKGTQGKMLGALDGYHHCSSGELFRQLDPSSHLGRVAMEYSLRGDLVPDEMTVRIWAHHMRDIIHARQFDPTRELLLLDGIPRSVNQARLLNHDVDVQRVIHLEASDEEKLVKRIRDRALKQNREDDADEAVIRHRLRVYHDETAPLLEFYPQDRVVHIDALPSIEQVHQAILEVVTPLHDALVRA